MATRAAGAPLLLEPGDKFAVLLTGAESKGDGTVDVHLDLAVGPGLRVVGDPAKIPSAGGRELVVLGLCALGAPDGLRDRIMVAVDAFRRQQGVVG